MNDGGADHRGVSDGHDASGDFFLRIEPGRDPRHQRQCRLAAMGRRGGVAHPFDDSFGLLSFDIVKRKAGPSAVITLPQQGIDCCIQQQRLRGLDSSQGGAGPEPVGIAQTGIYGQVT